MKKIDLIENWVEPTEVTEWAATEWGVSNGVGRMFPIWYSYIAVKINPYDMGVLFRVIFPAFVQVNGCGLLELNIKGQSPEHLTDHIEQNDWIISDFERSFNVLRIRELFIYSEVKCEEIYYQVAVMLKRSWEISLQLASPHKSFEVEVSNLESDFGPDLYFFSIEKNERT